MHIINNIVLMYFSDTCRSISKHFDTLVHIKISKCYISIYIYFATDDVTYICDFETDTEPSCFLVESKTDDYDLERMSVLVSFSFFH